MRPLLAIPLTVSAVAATMALAACHEHEPLAPRPPSAAVARRSPKPPIRDTLVIGVPVEPPIVLNSAATVP